MPYSGYDDRPNISYGFLTPSLSTLNSALGFDLLLTDAAVPTAG